MESSTTIAKQIEAEQAGIAAADTSIAALRTKRGDILLSGDDKAIDRLEDEIEANTRKRARHAERVEALTGKLAEAVEHERRSSLAALATRAAKARKLGEALITGDYQKQAKALAGTLTKLAVLERFVSLANNEVQAAGGEGLQGPNAIRCRLGEREPDRTERQRVNCHHPKHPDFHDKVETGAINGPRWIRASDKRPIEDAEVDVVIPGRVLTDIVEPLQTAVLLPQLRSGQPDVWSERIADQALANYDATLKELGV